MQFTRLRVVGLPLAANILLSSTVLPLLIPSFRGPTFTDLAEVLFWQAVGVISWPFAVVGSLLGLAHPEVSVEPAAFALTLLYPAMAFLLARSLTATAPPRWSLRLLHMTVAASFFAVWYQVLNGYDFMLG